MNYPTDQRNGAARAASASWAWIIAICTLGYMLPWAVAASRGARNSAQVFWLNLLLGWTLIGWVVALVMALRVHQPVPVPYAPPTTGDPAAGAAPAAPAKAQWTTGPDGQMHFTPSPDRPVARNPLASNSALNNRLRNSPTAMKVIPVFVVAAFAALIVAVAIPGDKDGATAAPSTSTSSSSSSSSTPSLDDAQTTSTTEEEPQAEEKPSMTAGQSNAVREAESYLETSAFSRKSLIKQLQFEGFSATDSAYAADHVDVDWKEQAAKSAKDYLDTSGFSRSGLIKQLEFEGFTAAQARHGVTAAGL